MGEIKAEQSKKGKRSALRHPDPAVAKGIDDLLAVLPDGKQDLLQEILTRATQFADPDLDRGELKVLSSTLNDFYMSFKVFGQHRRTRKVSIFGSARSPADSQIYKLCHRFAAALAERGYMIITGAGPGIMQAGNEGATAAKSFGVSIDLPFEAAANEVIHGDSKHVHFKYFFTRKLSFVKESDAIVLFPGGMGTMDEGFESLTLLQTGKCDPLPVVMMDMPGSNYWPSWEKYLRENLLRKGLISAADRNLFRVTTSIESAIHEIELFYRWYHSLRYVGSYCVLRLKAHPTEELLALLNERYRDLLAEGDFEIMKQFHSAERREPEEVRKLPRIGFRFVQRGFGRLRRLIDEINLADLAGEPELDSNAQPTGGHLTMVTDPKGD